MNFTGGLKSLRARSSGHAAWLFLAAVLAACHPTSGADGSVDAGVDAAVPDYCHHFPVPARLPDGGLDRDGGIFTHFSGDVVDESGGVFASEGDVAPLLGCFETTEVDLDPFDAGLIRASSSKVYRGCADVRAACPADDAGANDRWFEAPGATAPFNPWGDDVDAGNEPVANGPCTDGMRFSFERGTYAPWVGSGVFAQNAAVYGNNVSIDRIKPPGYIGTGASSPSSSVGGDYWEFSRDIGYQGNYWAGSMDVRRDWRTRPGTTLDAKLGGELLSPPFIIGTPSITFLIGGTRHSGQRVELIVQGNPNINTILKAQYRGIGVEEVVPGTAVPLEFMPDNIVVRASTSYADDEYMTRRVVWDVTPFMGMTARLRVVDESGLPGHVNVDDFGCAKTLPSGTQWLAAPDGGAPAIGQILRDQPLWGVTDSHAHVMSNLGFGGHYIWADPTDDLRNVYDCHAPLPEIRDRHAAVVREAIARPAQYTGCFISATVVGVIDAVGAGVCGLAAASVGWIPFAGPFLAAAVLTTCTVTLAAATAALTAMPAATTITQHGAAMPTSAGIRVGPFLSWLVSLFSNTDTSVHGMLELQDWDTQDGAHSGYGLTGSHQRYHATMIKRAYDGGLRLMVIDALHSRVLQYVFDGRDDIDDWQGIREQIEGVKRLVAPTTDPDYLPGPLRDIAEIAYTPGQARDIIRRNKLAIILGTETQELGKARFPGDTMDAQVAELYRLGVRKITAIHGIDNPLGGTGFFNDIYNSAGVFANLTKNQAGASDGHWEPLLPIAVPLPSTLPPPLGGMGLGTYQLLFNLQPNMSCAGPTCPWNTRNGGWFVAQQPTSATPDFIGDHAAITFRAGIEGSKNGRFRDEHDPFAEPEFQFASRLDSLEWLLGVGPGGVVPVTRCSLDGMFFPLFGGLDPAADANYRATPTQMNDKGLSPLGAEFLDAMLKRGMIVDTDHFGQKTRADTHALLATFAADAGLGTTDEYPILAIHSDVRRYSRHGPYPLDLDGGSDYAQTLGFGVETDKSRAEVEHIAQNKGVISPGVNGVVVEDPDHLVGRQVNNDCDYSSKSYAIKYLQMVRLMKGHGVTPSTDMNSPSPQLRSRFGNDTACFSGDRPGRREGATDGDDGKPLVASWPRDWTPDRVADCRFNSARPPDSRLPQCHSTIAAQNQLLELNGVEYDDYATRAPATWSPPAGSPATARVVVAQQASEVRDDAAFSQRGVTQIVAYGGGGQLRQIRPMHKFRTGFVADATNRGWDVNIDGLTNEGLLPDVWQDMRNVGVAWEQLGPMFNSANDFLEMWEQGCRMGERWHVARGDRPLAGCD